MKSALIKSLLTLIALPLAACTSVPFGGPDESQRVDAFELAEKSDRIDYAEPAELAEFESDTNAPYEVGPGDVFDLTVWGRPELSGQFKVGPDGRIQLPLVGGVEVAGLSTPRLNQAIATAFEQYYVSPSVNTQMKDYVSNRITVLGRVENPGYIQFEQRPTLLEALARAGSLPVIDKQANLTRVAVFRGREKVIWVDMRNLLSKGLLNYNIRLKANDLVYIPDSGDTMVYVMGAVNKPGAYRLTPNMSLLDALAQAGGPNEDAAAESLALYRPGSKAVQQIPLSTLLNNEPQRNFALNEGDVLYVPKSGLANVGYTLRQLLPGLSFITFMGAVSD